MGFFAFLHKVFIPSYHNAYRPHMLRKGVLLSLLGVIVAAEGILVVNLFARQTNFDFTATVIQSEIIALTNERRADYSVSAVKEDTLLNQSAQAKADEMAALGYFAHESPTGKKAWELIEDSGYAYQFAGENLAVRFVDSKDVLNGWMNSPSHRANIIKPNYTDIGVGVAQGMYKGEPATFVVQHFATPESGRMSGAVAGEVLAAHIGPPASFNDSLARVLGKLISDPRSSTAWILGSVGVFLVAALGFAFFHHIQVQARDLLLPGAVVAGVAFALLVVNNQSLFVGDSGETLQSASVGHYTGVLLTPEAAAIER